MTEKKTNAHTKTNASNAVDSNKINNNKASVGELNNNLVDELNNNSSVGKLNNNKAPNVPVDNMALSEVNNNSVPLNEINNHNSVPVNEPSNNSTPNVPADEL